VAIAVECRSQFLKVLPRSIRYNIAMPTLTPFLVFPCVLFFLWMGAMALLHPSQFLRPMDIQAATVNARNEIRAVYGGFGLAMAGMLLGAWIWHAHLSGIALALGLSMAGMALGRVISALVDRQFGKLPVVFFFVELALATALLTVFWQGR
jgi:hypothetical protein